MKRGYFIFLLFALSILLFSSGVIAAEDSGFKEDASALWGNVTESTSNIYNNITEGIDRFFGFKTLEGEDVLGEMDWEEFFIVTILMGAVGLGMIVFVFLQHLEEEEEASFKLVIKSGIIGFLISTFLYILLTKFIIFPLDKLLTVTLPTFIFIFIFYTLYFLGWKEKSEIILFKREFIEENKEILLIIFIYPFLTKIPILNRILQILTLEFLGLHWFWRSLIIATVLYFGPLYFDRYKEYRKRTRIYNRKLENIAIREGAKTLLKR